jgi:hypothetical protein
MSGRGGAGSKVVRLDIPRTRGNATRRAVRLTEEERQVLLNELAEVTAQLNEIQSRSMEIAARVLHTASTERARTA